MVLQAATVTWKHFKVGDESPAIRLKSRIEIYIAFPARNAKAPVQIFLSSPVVLLSFFQSFCSRTIADRL